MNIATNLKNVLASINTATKNSAREKNSVTLIAVSKTKPVDDILIAWQAGQRHFGENKVQEAQKKFIPLREKKMDFTLHLIGPLQTNKIADAVALFDVIHTVDRLKLAEALQKEMHKQQRYPELLIEVNTGKEPQKAGILPEATESFVNESRALGLKINGLMCIPPLNEDPRSHFNLLANLAKKLKLSQLSMGMSHDYEIAIECGATYVRVGTAIFGERNNV